MKQTIPLRVKLALTEYKSSTPTWIYIFNRSVCGTHETRQRLAQDGTAVVPVYAAVTDEIEANSTFWCFVSVEREMKADGSVTDSKFFQGSQPFLTRAGFATFTLEQCETKSFKSSKLYDIDGNDMGTLELRLAPDQGSYKITLLDTTSNKLKWCLPCAQLEKWTQYTTKRVEEIHAKYFKGGTNITKQLPRFMLTTIKQHCGTVPMWAFVPLNLLAYKEEKELNKYLQRSLDNATYLLGDQTKKGYAYMAELLNEMQTLPVRAQLYALDTTKVQGWEVSVDDWTNPQWAVVPRLHALDCEDGALRMLQESLWLHDATGLTGALAALQAVEREYLTFFVCMTLYLPSNKQWTYHAAAVKLDKQYMLTKLGLVKAATDSAVFVRPAVLLEATAYTTGCWNYHSETYTDDVAKASKAHFGRGDTICKDTSKAVQKKKLYGHMQTLFSPVLFRDYGVMQIELGYRDKLGAPAELLMNYSSEVDMHVVQQQQQDRKELYADVKELQHAAYPLPPLPRVSSKSPPPQHKVATRANFCMRKVDWDDPSAQETLTDIYGDTLHGTVLEIAQDLEIVHVTL